MNITRKNSPLPWRVEPALRATGYGGVCAADNSVEFCVDEGYETGYMRIEDAEFIVKAVNSHDALVEALKAVLEWYALDGDGISDPVRQQVIDALKLADAEQIANAQP